MGPLRAPRKPLRTSVPPRPVQPGEAEWKAVRWGRCQNCGIEGTVQRHHVVAAQALKRAAPDRLWDLRNGMLVCVRCHEAHTNAHRRIPLERVPVAAKQYAHEILGPAATDYLARHYAR